MQIIGAEGVARIIDVFATAMTFRAKVADLIQLDLAFTPPISTPVDPVLVTGVNLYNALTGAPLLTPAELNQMKETDAEVLLLDIRSAGDYEADHIAGAQHLPVDDLRAKLDTLNKEQCVVVYSNTGEKAYVAQEILLNSGFEEVYNLSGGIINYRNLFKSEK